MKKKIVILGATGRIGSQICQLGTKLKYSIIEVKRQQYQNWSEPEEIQNYFETIDLTQGDTVICASGIINPKEDPDKIITANLKTPSLVCHAARKIGANAVTLGTVLEQIIPQNDQNPYVRSKCLLAQEAKNNWLHLQLHTIYGGHAPDPFMFVGQAVNALNTNNRFSMTSGEQMREYHHVEDVAEAILNLSSLSQTDCIDISHGDYMSLRDLAEAIFQHFDQSKLLGVGDLKAPQNEAFRQSFSKHALLKNHNFRPTLPHVLLWLENYVDRF